MSSNAPRRGKVLSPPQPSASKLAVNPSTPSNKFSSRGKVLGKTPPASNQSASGSFHGDNDRDSLSNLKHVIHEAKNAASARRQEVASKRDRVFDDLNQAENIILSLLDCASNVAKSLSDMTTAKIGGEKGNNIVDVNSLEDLAARIRGNGVGYLAGVKKLHQLLAPHASLVKSYKNPEGGDVETTPETNATKISDVLIKKATSNMYAARVEKRLAMEWSAILKEMIRLEELESSERGNVSIESDGAVGSKRKHEAIE